MKAVWGVAYKAACGACLVWLAVVLGVAVHYGWRALVADTFVIPSDSMSPTLLPGDKVRVDKTVFGARLYTSLDFTDGRMESIRTRGRRGLRYNDIVVFNYPVNDKGRIGFKMNYVYVKRVVAFRSEVRDGRFRLVGPAERTGGECRYLHHQRVQQPNGGLQGAGVASCEFVRQGLQPQDYSGVPDHAFHRFGLGAVPHRWAGGSFLVLFRHRNVGRPAVFHPGPDIRHAHLHAFEEGYFRFCAAYADGVMPNISLK